MWSAHHRRLQPAEVASMTGLTVIPYSWDGVPPFGPSLDDAYEDDLRTCRTEGHDLEMGLVHAGREFLRCVRCGARFEEIEE